MANEVEVNTTYAFVSDDGTAYSENHTYFSDANTTASRARRMMFNATTAGPTVLEFGAVPSYTLQLSGPCLLLVVNRSARQDMWVTLGSGSDNQTRKLRANEWLFLDVSDMDGSAFADPLAYGAQSLQTVVATSQNSDVQGEYLCIYKAAS